MLFNDRATLSLDQIRAGVGAVPESELRRHLLSLCTPKLRILRKSSTGKVSALVDYVCLLCSIEYILAFSDHLLFLFIFNYLSVTFTSINIGNRG